ncbi:ATP-binding cassette sub- A member 1 [Mortierella polycephala]|uniref:ATP-binding cassette sub- A member 1 n=1 Tax=Mortierella polycephala TaxID=41804 RepID=A0A9P6Q3P7_9FUNG|nr:ATP-binding cassette sub- A member 1 [Mortierella polycephala]
MASPRTPSPLPSSTSFSTAAHHHNNNHGEIRGMDIIKATRKPTKMDHFWTMTAHNFRVTLRDPSVYIFGALIPLLTIGIAIGISLGIQSGIPKTVAGSVDSRTFTTQEAGLKQMHEYVVKPVAYFPVVKSVPSLNILTDSVVKNLGQTYAEYNPVFIDYVSMDDVASYEHQNAKDMLKNRTLKDYTPQLGFELDALGPSSSNGVASVDLGFTIVTAKNDSIPFLLSSMNQFLQNVDAASGSDDATAGLGLRFLPTLKTFGAQGDENVDIPSSIVPAFMTFAFSFFTTFVAANLVTEKELGQKTHLQNMGIKPSTYYLARFVIDWISYLVPVVASFVLMGVTRLQMITSGSWVPYLLLLLVSGLPFITFGYFLSLFFQKSQSVGQVLGVGMSLVVFVPYFFVQFVFEGASLLAIILVGFISPSFALERSISAIALAQTTGSPYSIGDTFDITKVPFCCMILFVVQSFIYLLLISWIENLIQTRRSPIDFFFRRNKNNMNHTVASQKSRDHSEDGLQQQDTAVLVDGKYRERDAEVVEEALRLKGKAGSPDENDAVRLNGLSKVFHLASKKRDLVILDDIYLSFKKNECFGYLGPNGAGKTTTIKILTGAEGPTSGNATIEGLSIAPFHEDLRSMIGICPQFDILWPKLTVRDHLELFAKIKGVAPSDMDASINQMIEEMGLTGLGNKRAKTFSGGNKRRLSLAMAVIGCPKVVFLDEPTTGVDVSIRQAIWNSIRKLKRTSCVILTTHSMEEADALCDRIGIITNGHIQALGTSQRLRNTYGAGYKVVVKTHHNVDAVTMALEQTVGPGRVQLVQALGMSLEYELSRVEGERTTDMLSRLFRLFETMRQQLGIEDYSVSQTTLAQVFIEFAKEQAAPEK